MADGFEFLKGKSVAVTGGAGFIGTNITRELLEHGAKVVCLDNFATGHRKNIQPFFSNSNYRLVEGDIRVPEDCNEAFAGVDYVLHQAALGSVPRSVADPVESTSVNVTGFVTVLHTARLAGVKKVVYASSSSVYGDSQSLPKKEPDLGMPLSPYAAGKHSCELLASSFAAAYDMAVVGLRYFNVFGPHQDPSGAYSAVVPRFAAALLAGKRPVINGNGDAISRDFTYAGNVVRANILAIAAGPQANGKAFNIACGGSVTLNELLAAMKREISCYVPAAADIEPEYDSVRVGDIPASCADISLAGKVLGYKPEITFAEGIKRTCRWYAGESHKI